MIKQLTEEELEFMDCFYDSICMAECLYTDVDNLSAYDPNEFGEVRTGQLTMMSYEYDIDCEQPDLSPNENFKLREGAGTVYGLGGRNYGKTITVVKIDVPIDALIVDGDKTGLTSYDKDHIDGVLEDICLCFEQHPIISKLVKFKVKRSPTYTINASNGWKLVSINMNITGKKPGESFFQKHLTKLWIEEASKETNKVYEKRIDSVDEKGCVIRAAGMTDFTRHSPCGRIWNDLSMKRFICNLSQYVNPNWDAAKKKLAIKKHNGEDSITYRIFVRGLVVTEGISVFDMERIREQYLKNKKDENILIKHFEIKKETFNDFTNLIIVDKPKQAECTYICADIGETAATEIIILFQINDKYKYQYNITLYGLDDKQQARIFKWLAEKLGANFIGLDVTDGTGRAIYRSLEAKLGKEHMVWCHFNEKIPVGFETSDDGEVVCKDGEPVTKEEYVAEWSIQRLKTILYEERVLLPLDYKFDKQLDGIISTQSGNRTIYKPITEEDHILAAWRVFAIAQWSNEFNLIKPISTKKHCKSGV